jgi:hypothetical protein
LYIIHYSNSVPQFVAVYRQALFEELWPTRKTSKYGNLFIIPDLSYGTEDSGKFIESNCVVSNDYQSASTTAYNLASALDLV